MSLLSTTAFIGKWKGYNGTERAGAQPHFLDLCEVLGRPAPSTDPNDPDYAFEKRVTKSTGGQGFADVWWKGHFAWEYKARGGNLTMAYNQLLQYKDSLENPRLLVVCDFERFRVHTNFPDTPARRYEFSLAELGENGPLPDTTLTPLEILHALFEDPGRLKPDRTTARVTEEAAAQVAKLAESLEAYGAEPEPAARFLVRILFCLFAQDVGLLPDRLFTELVKRNRTRAPDFTRRLRALFQAMATGDAFGEHDIPYFDGGLFADSEALDLASDDMDILARACTMDWGSVEPVIFGTLFERSLNRSKRAQLGAHYTSFADIREIVEPVLMAPLRREWSAVKERATGLIAMRDAASEEEMTRLQAEVGDLLFGFAQRLAGVRVLDPACGSGNFLYVALKELLSLEKEAIAFAAANSVLDWYPRVSPSQLHGIEIDPYAHELAQAVIWIGYLQWMRDNGFTVDKQPILSPLESIRHMDAILDHDDQGRPIEPEWPEADVIIGNPPFLGGNRIRQRLGDRYVEELFALYEGRVPRFADLVCYWFERARELIQADKVKRAGLLATQGIRGGANRRALERIKETGDIFWAQSDRDWIQDGVAVHVSMVGFDDGTETARVLNGSSVAQINPDLTAAMDLTTSVILPENSGISFQGPSPKAPFDVEWAIAQKMLNAPLNVNGRPNSDVVRPVASAIDLTQGSRHRWTIDFGLMPLETAAQYEKPFEYVKEHVFPVRSHNRRVAYAEKWWHYAEARPGMRRALQNKSRYAATPCHAKHRIFVWVNANVLCNQATIVFARDDDYFFGMLHSKPHELWARATGTQVREAESGFRYTPTSTFETFPFPWSPGKEPAGDTRVEAIAQAARELVEQRDRWLNPEGVTEAQLRERTLTNLYNRRPEWLQVAHRKLDGAVMDSYGWPHDLGDQEILERLLALNHQRAATQDDPPA